MGRGFDPLDILYSLQITVFWDCMTNMVKTTMRAVVSLNRSTVLAVDAGIGNIACRKWMFPKALSLF